MKGKTILITGANSGIGKATAMGLAKMDARVVLLCRNREKGESARQEIMEQSGNRDPDLVVIDLADLTSVRLAAVEILERYPQIHVLINNAGGYFSRRDTTAEGFEYTFGMNHLGHFLLTNLLLDRITGTEKSRIINVSSEAQRQGHIDFDDLMQEKGKYSGFRAYSQAKLANIIFTKGLAERIWRTGTTVNAVHPGAVRTGFGKNSAGLMKFVVLVAGPFMRSPEKGAETSIFLASSESVNGVTGKYFYNRMEKNPIPEASDGVVIRQLWEVSERLTGLAR